MSVGTVTTGYVGGGVPGPAPARHLAVLPRQRRRRLRHATGALVGALQRAAARVAARYPGTVTYLGNLGAPTGGDIRWSVSHNSGRDADLAYYSTDPGGVVVEPPDLLPFDSLGWSFDERGAYRFDAPRTWELVRALLEDEQVVVQFFFIYRPLQRLILRHAERSGASPELIGAARQRFLQPGASPHNDHIHLRIHCTRADLDNGCVEIGPRRPGAPDPREIVAERVAGVLPLLRSPEPGQRYRAAALLGLLGDRGAGRALGRLVTDEAPAVRYAAVHSLASLKARGAAAAIATQAAAETDAAVIAEALEALARLGGRAAERGLVAACSDQRWAWSGTLGDYARGYRAGAPSGQLRPVSEVPEAEGVFLPRVAAATALAASSRSAAVVALLPLLDDPAPPARAAARHALSRVLNHDLGSEPEPWRRWWRGHRGQPRRRWLVAGFVGAGFSVAEALDMESAPELLRAIRGPAHISHNARRELARLLRGAHPSHLSWSAADAHSFWSRRYRRVLRRRKRRRRRR